MRRLDLEEERQKVDIEICRQYKNIFIRNISNISMGNRDESLTVIEKIKSCMKEVKKKVKEFESSRFGRGYRINCDVSERNNFAKMIINLVHYSDYIRKFYEVWEDSYYGNNISLKAAFYRLVKKYVQLQGWIKMLANMEETNMYD